MTGTTSPEDLSAQVAALILEVNRLKQQNAEQAAAGSSSSSAAPEPEEQGPWVPHYATTNPHATRPTYLSDEPQYFELGSDLTYDRLGRNKGTALRYEYRTSETVASSLFNCTTELDFILGPAQRALVQARSCEQGKDPNEKVSEADQELDDTIWSLHALSKSLGKSYKILAQRLDYIRLKAKFDDNPNGMSLSEKTLLQYLEEKTVGVADGLHVVDQQVNGWLVDFGEAANKATLNYSAKLRAHESAGRGGGRGRSKGGKGRGGKGGGKGAPPTSQE